MYSPLKLECISPIGIPALRVSRQESISKVLHTFALGKWDSGRLHPHALFTRQ